MVGLLKSFFFSDNQYAILYVATIHLILFCPLHIYMCFVRLLSLQSLQFPFDNLIRHVCASLNKAAMQGKEIVILRKFIDFLAEVTVPFTFSGIIKSRILEKSQVQKWVEFSINTCDLERPQTSYTGSYRQWHDAKKGGHRCASSGCAFLQVPLNNACSLNVRKKSQSTTPPCRALKPKPHSLKTITFTGVDHFIPACRPPQIIYSVN